nr:putative sporulation protein YtxC [Paenibacillus bovis]
MFTSIKEAIRFKIFLSANGLQDSFMERRNQFIYSFQQLLTKKDRYLSAFIQYIQEEKRNEWINRVLYETYKFENEEERNEILEIVSEMFLGERPELTSLAGQFDENAIISEAVMDLLDFNGTVSFDSFHRFRLKKYYEHVSNYLAIAIDEYKMEQDYQMFVHMLREYLRKRPTQKNIIHVLFTNSTIFYDESLTEMTREELHELIDRRLLSNHPVYVDSAIIAPLLSIAPNKVFLYTENEDQPLIRTLQNIFEERLIIFTPQHFYALSEAYSQNP